MANRLIEILEFQKGFRVARPFCFGSQSRPGATTQVFHAPTVFDFPAALISIRRERAAADIGALISRTPLLYSAVIFAWNMHDGGGILCSVCRDVTDQRVRYLGLIKMRLQARGHCHRQPPVAALARRSGLHGFLPISDRERPRTLSVEAPAHLGIPDRHS